MCLSSSSFQPHRLGFVFVFSPSELSECITHRVIRWISDLRTANGSWRSRRRAAGNYVFPLKEWKFKKKKWILNTEHARIVPFIQVTNQGFSKQTAAAH